MAVALQPSQRSGAPVAPCRRTGSRGFTLIELMIVIAMIALASGLAALALRDPSSTQLEQEGARLTALLESARAEARGLGLAVSWAPRPLLSDEPGLSGSGSGDPRFASDGPPADFTFVGLPAGAGLPRRWLARGVSADVVGARAVVLGPEPLIGAQRIVLSLNDRRLTLATDGLGPFTVVDDSAPAVR